MTGVMGLTEVGPVPCPRPLPYCPRPPPRPGCAGVSGCTVGVVFQCWCPFQAPTGYGVGGCDGVGFWLCSKVVTKVWSHASRRWYSPADSGRWDYFPPKRELHVAL